jgi:hypothetical protein
MNRLVRRRQRGVQLVHGILLRLCRVFEEDGHGSRTQEYEKTGMVNSASTPLAMWRKLIKEADLTGQSAKRLEDPRNKEKWRLRFHNHNARFPSSSVSVFDVSKVGSRSFCVLTRLMFIPKVALDWPRSRSGPATCTNVLPI